MKLKVDVTKVVEEVKKILRRKNKNAPFFIGGLTCGEVLDAVENETEFGVDFIKALVEGSMRLWIIKFANLAPGVSCFCGAPRVKRTPSVHRALETQAAKRIPAFYKKADRSTKRY